MWFFVQVHAVAMRLGKPITNLMSIKARLGQVWL